MKAITLILGLFVYSLSSFSFAADGKMPGDNLDLNAVLELFKNSKSIEDFENKLNSEKTNINNLDLNADGFVDYIRVVDCVKDNAHLITLQVAFTANEIQDIAVIELDRTDDKTVVQIVGDEALYGRDYIIEPISENEKVAYNANNWTSVQYIYGPRYVVYVSPWYYGFYPQWHNPWRPYSWDVYYGYVYPFYGYYRHCGYYRSYHAHNYYHHGHKSHSNTYYNSPMHKTAQKSLPVNKQSLNEGNVKEQTGKTVDGSGKTVVNQREVRQVNTKPIESNPARNSNTRATETPTTRTQPPTRTQPATTQPTRTTPTRTQPTRTQPTTRPQTPTKTTPTRTQPTRTQPATRSTAPSKKAPAGSRKP